ncbi:endonuclease [Corynebacterium falsenii DSM 44353]|uniref:endonuclease NucS n=1 Tax=Corynebacterium falsenii TaxID=108486 RepID=UPI0003E96DC0|nr:endonuclease NucS [Corynebacterium falsenii]AHI03451.1 endonuclease [Corynebacterium falsenii DSM 44353]UBI04154.1 endonuclease NucS [Corynebacterium falsenii]
MRLVIASCSVDYVGRLEAHLPKADRLIMVKADGSVSIHADDRAYKPLNWMTPPCTLTVVSPEDDLTSDATLIYPELDNDGVKQLWIVENTKGEQLRIQIFAIHSDTSHELGEDPGLVKDGVESHLQELLAEQIELLGEGYTLVRREYPTAIGPVDILSKDSTGATVAVEIKRRGGIDGVEQLTRYVELLNRDELLAPVTGVFAAQEIKPQARTLAEDRGIRCVTLDYEAMRGTDSSEFRLF